MTVLVIGGLVFGSLVLLLVVLVFVIVPNRRERRTYDMLFGREVSRAVASRVRASASGRYAKVAGHNARRRSPPARRAGHVSAVNR